MFIMLQGLSVFARQLYGDLVDTISAGLHPYDILAAFQGFFPNYSQTLFNRDYNIVSDAVSKFDNMRRLNNSTIIRASMYAKKDAPYPNANYGHVVKFGYFNQATGDTGYRYITITSQTRLAKQDIYNSLDTAVQTQDYGNLIISAEVLATYKS